MPVAFCVALAAAIVFLTVVQTMAAYPSLPAQFPIHLDWNGRANGAGPRAMAFLVPGIQLCTAALLAFAGYSIAIGAPGTHGSLLGLSIIGVCVAALTWRVQMLLIESARSGLKPVPMRGFWVFFAAWLAVVVLDALVIG